jgi:EF-hand domain pair
MCVLVCVRITGSGTVDFNEFLRMMSRTHCHVSRAAGDHNSRSNEELEEMRQAFRVFDIDGNGIIDANELKITMFNLGENLSDREVKQMIRLADRNGDGKIDYEGMHQIAITKTMTARNDQFVTLVTRKSCCSHITLTETKPFIACILDILLLPLFMRVPLYVSTYYEPVHSNTVELTVII